jgi:hypothetical protein
VKRTRGLLAPTGTDAVVDVISCSPATSSKAMGGGAGDAGDTSGDFRARGTSASHLWSVGYVSRAGGGGYPSSSSSSSCVAGYRLPSSVPHMPCEITEVLDLTGDD